MPRGVYPRPPRRSLADRFWEKVDKSGDCWLWTASTFWHGYGAFSAGGHQGQMLYAHRVSWEFHFGPVPNGLLVCHHCDVKICVKPAHLFLGTALANNRDAQSKGRSARGAQHGIAKLTAARVLEIRARYAAGERNQRLLAREFGVHNATISDIVLRKYWKHI